MITVDGMPVRYMYREKPDNDLDSGWRFFAGSETDEYVEIPENCGIYDVNTIANYDPDIIPHLERLRAPRSNGSTAASRSSRSSISKLVTSAATASGTLSPSRHAARGCLFMRLDRSCRAGSRRCIISVSCWGHSISDWHSSVLFAMHAPRPQARGRISSAILANRFFMESPQNFAPCARPMDNCPWH
jgi:hypothetical protein